MRVGVMTGGGDCPGLNAVIRGLVRKVERGYGGEVVGFLDGWRGVIEDDTVALTVDSCRGILPRGGTILGTSRTTPHRTEGGIAAARDTLARHGVDGLVVIGGEGTLSSALDLYRLDPVGFPVVGVPKTIDNDISCTEMTFGFQTAVEIATDAIDRLHTTAESHDRVMVVEVMGRHVGHIATWAGIAGGATMTLIPEHPFDIDAVCEALRRRHERGKWASIVVVAEGAVPVPGTLQIPEPTRDEFGHMRLGGIGSIVAQEIEARTGFETRVTVLGHVQRGGTPSAYDRVIATWFGVAAAELAHDGAFGQMVALQNGEVGRVAIADAVAELKTVGPRLWSVASEFFA
jgi:phosphofructokinase-like protein